MITHKKTKIIATIGPVSESEEILEKLIKAGVDVARLNFSHGSHEEHGNRITLVRKLSKKLGKNVAIIADIQGPKIRIGNMPQEGVELKNGEEITIDSETKEYVEGKIPLPSLLFRDGTKEGHTVHLDDGTMQIKITSKKGGIFKAVVLKGGILFSKKGVNVPELDINSSILNDKDKADIEFAVKAGADYIALSFLRTAQDVRDAKEFMGKTTTQIIAKIERPEALVNIDEIIEEADAVMVARGDLGIETPLWELPIRQKSIIEKVRRKMKPVIVATQMLDSMIRNPIPTRAEVSDVANAVYDSADCVMLSGESANGKYPVETVEMMSKILESTEKNQDYGDNHRPDPTLKEVISHSVTHMAAEVEAKAIFTGAITGSSARMISHYRPQTDIVAVTTDEKVAQQLSLVWGITSFLVESKKIKNASEILIPSIEAFKKKGLLKTGDRIVYRYDERLGDSDSPNTITIESVG